MHRLLSCLGILVFTLSVLIGVRSRAEVDADSPPSPETVDRTSELELKGGPRIRFDSMVWRQWSKPKAPRISMVWTHHQNRDVRVRVHSSNEKIEHDLFAKRVLVGLPVREFRTEFVRSRTETLNGRDWWVDEYATETKRGDRHEWHYFRTTKTGYVAVIVTCPDHELARRKNAIRRLLEGVDVD